MTTSVVDCKDVVMILPQKVGINNPKRRKKINVVDRAYKCDVRDASVDFEWYLARLNIRIYDQNFGDSVMICLRPVIHWPRISGYGSSLIVSSEACLNPNPTGAEVQTSHHSLSTSALSQKIVNKG